MNRIFNIIIVVLILTGCSFKNNEIISLVTLDQFEIPEENKQLGKDLITYKFPDLKEELSDLNNEALKNIRYQTHETSGQQSFELVLSNDALDYKEKIVSYFKVTINEQIDRQIKDKEIFDKAIALTLESLEMLDNHEQEQFWENTSYILRKIVEKENFFTQIKNRDDISKIGGERILYSKHYYETIPKVKEKGFYVICFTFGNDEQMFEQLTFVKQNDSLKISGYDYRMPN